jgi:hypothetical protein
LSQNHITMRFTIILLRVVNKEVDLDSQSYDNTIYNNIIRDIPSQSDALYLEEGSAEQNTLYSNVLIDSNGNKIDLDYMCNKDWADVNSSFRI